MKKLIILLLAFLSVLNKNHAQLKTLSFGDGNIIDYEITERDTEKAKKSSFRIGLGSVGISYQYVNPQKFVLDLGVSMTGGATGGLLYSFYTYKKEKTKQISLKRVKTSSTTVYYRSEDEKIIHSHFVGVHLGARYISKIINPYSAVAVAAGIGKFKTVHLKAFINDKKEGKNYRYSYTNRSGLNLDFLYFPVVNYEVENSDTGMPEKSTNYSKIGFLAMYELNGFSSKKDRHGAGIVFQAGAGMGPVGFLGLLGLGVCF
jgi:hypothetical protein